MNLVLNIYKDTISSYHLWFRRPHQRGKCGAWLAFQTVQAINETYAKSRKCFKKIKLNWWTNTPKTKRKSLGWLDIL